MINLAKKVKTTASPGNEDNNNKSATCVNSSSRLNSSKKALIRDKLLLKEIQEIESNLPQNCKITFSNPNELHKIELIIQPTESFWAGGKFLFTIDVPEDYNFVPPKVKCKTRIWHPNINEEGDICLSILRENSFDGLGWAPTRTLKDVVWGLDSLFTDLLNFDDALNEKAAQHYLNDKVAFKNKVREYILKYAR